MNTEVWTQWESQIVNGVFPLRRFLGSSNDSAVFLTEHKARNLANAAIKFVPVDKSQAEAQLQQWRKAAALSHPHLVRLFDAGRYQSDGREYLFVVMEYADQTLAQILSRRALSADEALELLLPTLDTLGFLHRNQLVHSRLRPSNLMAVNDQLKLASDTVRSPGHFTGSIVGASPYDPPELKDGGVTAAGDIWSLGMTLLEALTQRTVPWPEDQRAIVSLPAGIPAPFGSTVRRCLSTAPADRPTVTDLEDRHKPAQQASPIANAPPPAREAPPEAASPQEAAARLQGADPSQGVVRPQVAAPSQEVARPKVATPPQEVARPQVAAPPQEVARPKVATPPQEIARPQVAAPSQAVTRPRATAPSHEVARPQAAAPSQEVARPQATAPSQPAAPPPAAARPHVATPSQEVARPQVATPRQEAPPPEGVAQRRWLLPAIAVIFLVSLAVWVGLHFSSRSPAPSQTQAAAPTSAPIAPASSAKPAESTAKLSKKPVSPPRNQPPSAPAATSSFVLHEVMPEVPFKIRDKIRGRVHVTVRVLVDPSGNVVGKMLEDPGPSKYFARLADQAAGEWTFVPAEKQSARVWLLRFEFTRSATTARAIAQ